MGQTPAVEDHRRRQTHAGQYAFGNRGQEISLSDEGGSDCLRSIFSISRCTIAKNNCGDCILQEDDLSVGEVRVELAALWE